MVALLGVVNPFKIRLAIFCRWFPRGDQKPHAHPVGRGVFAYPNKVSNRHADQTLDGSAGLCSNSSRPTGQRQEGKKMNELDKLIITRAYTYFLLKDMQPEMVKKQVDNLMFCVQMGYNTRSEILGLLKIAMAA